MFRVCFLTIVNSARSSEQLIRYNLVRILGTVHCGSKATIASLSISTLYIYLCPGHPIYLQSGEMVPASNTSTAIFFKASSSPLVSTCSRRSFAWNRYHCIPLHCPIGTHDHMRPPKASPVSIFGVLGTDMAWHRIIYYQHNPTCHWFGSQSLFRSALACSHFHPSLPGESKCL